MTSPAKDIAALLQSLSFGTQGTDIFVNYLPDRPDNAICLYDRESEANISAVVAINTVKVAIQIRNQSQGTAYTITENIKLALQSRDNYIVNGDDYFGFWVQSEPSFLGVDERFNSIYTVIFRLNIRPNSKGNRI